MRTALVGIVLTVLLLASPTVAQDQEKRTTITGWPPYTFGADLTTILQANGTLKKGCIVGGQQVREPAGLLCVQGTVGAPIAGHAYSATLLLEFTNDRLESFMLMWTFDSPTSRRMATGALEGELRANYADELRRESKGAPLELRQQLATILGLQRPQDATVYVTPWQDAQGNTLALIDAWGQPTLLLIYASARAAGVTAPPLPPAKY